MKILREAEKELWEAVAYYEEKAPGLGLDFQAELATTLKVIQETPDRWPLREDGTRRCLTHRFPYVIIYTHISGGIWIIAVAHCKREPRYWDGRIRTSNGPLS